MNTFTREQEYMRKQIHCEAESPAGNGLGTFEFIHTVKYYSTIKKNEINL